MIPSVSKMPAKKLEEWTFADPKLSSLPLDPETQNFVRDILYDILLMIFEMKSNGPLNEYFCILTLSSKRKRERAIR